MRNSVWLSELPLHIFPFKRIYSCSLRMSSSARSLVTAVKSCKSYWRRLRSDLFDPIHLLIQWRRQKVHWQHRFVSVYDHSASGVPSPNDLLMFVPVPIYQWSPSMLRRVLISKNPVIYSELFMLGQEDPEASIVTGRSFPYGLV